MKTFATQFAHQPVIKATICFEQANRPEVMDNDAQVLAIGGGSSN